MRVSESERANLLSREGVKEREGGRERGSEREGEERGKRRVRDIA